ncbi:MAG: putative monovalent cation/H+ antiporter subunit A [Luteibaculaceae bacterium]
MLLAVLSGVIVAASLLLLGKYLKGKLAVLLSLLPLSLFIFFFSKLSQVCCLGVATGENAIKVTYNWIPSLGVNLAFSLDGLSLLFALLITGIGTLVFLYTSNYLKGHAFLDKFYGYLSLFMAAMLGLVLSDNLITMFVFWELTSISSYFLIGFNNHEESSRKSALLALSVTGFGGLALLAAAIIMGSAAGTYTISEIIANPPQFETEGLYLGTIVLIFLAAFTKSAQFPFHFWLPGAMKAPTPVSTYLHSATMVKAGIYLLLRFTPALGDHVWWNYPLITIGAITMLYAAIQTLFHTDLKSILAYSTISALGVLTFLIGLGTTDALLAAGIFILVHALYKATLFLVTGIIDHETHSRDVTQLAGLRKVIPIVFVAGGLAAVSNAGIPPTFGFLGKDLIYEAILHQDVLTFILLFVSVATNALLMYAGFMVGIKPFLGTLPQKFEKVHMPSPLLWVPPLLLASLGIVFGLFPKLIQTGIAEAFTASVIAEPYAFKLKLWHGFNFVLLLSAITVGLGLALYFFFKPSHKIEQSVAKLENIAPKAWALNIGKAFSTFSAKITAIIQNEHLSYYVYSTVLFTTAIVGYKLITGTDFYIDFASLTELTIYEVATVLILIISIFYTIYTESRLRAIVAMGVVGFCLSLIFVYYSAPDLAMTQFSIDTLTVILFVLVLHKLPKYNKRSKPVVRFRDASLSAVFGLLITFVALEVLAEPTNKEISTFYADNAYILAKGKNVVNVILVDFRGIDTFMEIAVLAIAALGVFALLKLRIKKNEQVEV